MASTFEPPPLLFLAWDDQIAERNALALIEEGKWYDLDNKWKVRSDNPHVDGMKYHNHLYLKGNEVFVINRDGTSSHGSNLSKLPQYVRLMLKNKNLLEGHLVETAASGGSSLVPVSLIDTLHAAIEHGRKLARLMRAVGM